MNQKIITDLLPSSQLRDAIAKTNHNFSEKELLLITDQYAKTQKQKIELLQYTADHSENERLKNTVRQAVDKMKKALEKMMTEESGTVYFLTIRENKGAYQEQYFCKNYAAAYKTIQAFQKEYSIKFNEYSEIRICKCKIFGEDFDFENNELGEIFLNENLAIKSASYWEISDTISFDIQENDEHADQILYPQILPPYSPVKFRTDYETEYGLQINSFRDDVYDDAYVLQLDSESADAESLTEYADFHFHIPIPEIELIDEKDLPPKEKSNYDRLMNYLKSVNHIK